MARREVKRRARGAALALLLIAPAAAADPEVESNPAEVQVRGRRPPRAGQTTLAAEEIRGVPGAFGDHTRAIEALPGVTPIATGLPFFFVRGAPPGNNGYYLDGVRVPALFHIGLGPSVVHPGLVERVDLFPGGYPARFGRYVGGIVSAETRRPDPEPHVEGNLRLFDVGALASAPFAGDRGSALVAGRYSYTAALVSIAAPDARLDYWDYQARAAYAVGPRDTLSLFAFGSHDFLGEIRPERTRTDERPVPERLVTVLSTRFHRLDARWDRRLPRGGALRLAATLGVESTATDSIRGVRDRMAGARLLVEQPVGRDVLVHGGVDAQLDHYDLAPREARQETKPYYPPRDDVVVGAHLDAAIRAAPRWEVVPGLRADYFGSARRFEQAPRFEQRRASNAAVPAVDPRLVSRLRVAERVTLVSTFAVTHQAPSFFLPLPGLSIGRLAGGLQTGVQASQGAEVALPLGLTAAPTVFAHRYLGLTDFTATCGEVSDQDDDDCVERRVRGRTVGLELLVRRSLGERLSGFVSYTLSRTTRDTEVFLLGRRGVHATIPGDFDRTHVLNVVGSYDLGGGYRAGARFFFYTGRPYSDRALGFPVPPYNTNRMPGFHRFDLRFEKRWRVGRAGRVALVAEWLNATLQKEVIGVDCRARRAATLEEIRSAIRGEVPPGLLDACTFEEIGPITIPSLGVEGQF